MHEVKPQLQAPRTAPAPTSTPADRPTGITSDAAQQLAIRLLDRIPELAVRLREEILAKDETYATTKLLTPDELLHSLQQNLTRSVQVLADRVPDGVDVLDAARRTANTRADAGFPVESLLHAYRIGMEVLWGALLEEGRAHAPHLLSELLDDAVSVMQLIDELSMAAAATYRTRVEEADKRDRARRQAVLDLLLDGRGGDPRVVDQVARVLGLRPESRFAMVVVRADGSAEGLTTPPHDLLAVQGFTSEWRLAIDREVGLVDLGQAPVGRLVDALRAGGATPSGVSPAFTGLEAVPTHQHLAELALDAVTAEGSAVAELDAYLPEALIIAQPDVSAHIRRCAFGRLLAVSASKRAMFLQTLAAWFRNNRSTAEVGAELHCHRNTVLHRLARIEELTGRSLADDRDVLLLRLALLTERPG